ncbi:hypothetical protein BDR03DRAFT_969243 [Suillus americanus]|nr:hypothetical protein BDR03DRAFT_969243 [Suillus americanus]
MVEYIIRENDAVPGRPRVSYFEDERILLVKKFSSMHEAPFGHLELIFSSFCTAHAISGMRPGYPGF